MKQYIDKSALVAEIERRQKIHFNDYHINGNNSPADYGACNALTQILAFIDTLEAKEEILNKEGKTKLMKKCVHKAYKRGYDMGVLQTTNKINHNTKEVDLEKEFDNYAKEKDILACDVQFEPFTHLYNCAKHFFELGLKVQKGE